jgi:diacylglycerol kinase family enzyme
VRALLVVNPNASSTSPRTREVITSALGSQVDLTVTTTRARGHAQELAAHAVASGLDIVAVLGGDGTVNEVVNGLLGDDHRPDPDARPVLGIVPGGNANVMARALGLPNDPVEATGALMDAIRSRRSRTVGLGLAGDRWFTFNAGLGLDAEVIAGVERARSPRRGATSALYLRQALTQFLRDTDRSSPALTLRRSDGSSASGLFLAIVQNTAPWTYLGPRELHPNPEASFDSGLDLFALTSLDVVPTLRSVQQILAGKGGPRGKEVVRLHDEAELVLTASRPTALQVDGDHVGSTTDLVLRSVPNALRVLV